MEDRIKYILNKAAEKYNCFDFIELDPISIPHQYAQKQDIEISGFFSAIFAWGQRKTIINKSKELMTLMDNAPFDFVTNHTNSDIEHLLHFKHRTFNTEDLFYFIRFLKYHYTHFSSLEDAFCQTDIKNPSLKDRISSFHDYFFSLDNAPERTKKHLSTPKKNSACKRICMYLRWMVRKDNQNVDFGIWNKIQMADLIIPLDLHVMRTALHLGLISDEKANWNQAETLTNHLKELDEDDPTRYDFALFGLSIENKYS